MPRLISLTLPVVVALIAVACATQPPTDTPRDPVVNYRNDDITDMTAGQLREAVVAGQYSAVAVTGAFLERIQRLDPALNAIIETNPDALTIAGNLDRQLASGQKPGVLFAVPVVLKANIDTADAMATSAGSLALAQHHAAEDAFLVSRLREAGAVILAKANMSEWANFRSAQSTSGWSSLGGQTVNVYRTQFNPCGSSSGSAVAVAARLAPLAVGTETNGSIVCPAGHAGIVGLKPSVGRISRTGIIPIAISQDTAGPMARNVADAALLMRVLDGYDPRDRSTRTLGKKYPIIQPTPNANMEHIRIGVWRGYAGADRYPQINRMLDEKVAQLRALGATVIDPVDLQVGEIGALSKEVLLHEFKDGINRYLAATDLPANLRSLAGLIAYNDRHADRVMPHFGQDIFLAAQARGELRSEIYTTALQTVRKEANLQIAGALIAQGLEAIISVTNGPAWRTDWEKGDQLEVSNSTLPAVSGHPHLTMPMGMLDGFPIGLSIFAHRNGEHRTLQIAYSLEEVVEPIPAPALPTGANPH